MARKLAPLTYKLLSKRRFAMKTAVIYARYSSDRQTEQSIEGQVRVCND